MPTHFEKYEKVKFHHFTRDRGEKKKIFELPPPRLVSFWGPANFLFGCEVSFRLTTNHGIYQSLALSENQPSNNSKQTQRPDLGSYHHKLVLLNSYFLYMTTTTPSHRACTMDLGNLKNPSVWIHLVFANLHVLQINQKNDRLFSETP